MDMEMQAHYAHLFPIAYGSEEETMMMAGGQAVSYQQFMEPFNFATNFAKYIPKDLKTTPENQRRHLQSGGLVYNGGVGPASIIERATPECSTPSEFAAAVEASERLIVAMGSSYIEERAKAGRPQKLRIQRRVADTQFNTRASHDSFEGRDNYWLKHFEGSGSERLLMAHLATRSFMTGAGYVTPNGLRFAQKVETTAKIHNYGFSNSAYRVTFEENTGSRIEIRCNDINLSPWATQVRIGTSALYLTMMQTPLAEVMEKLLPDECGEDRLMLPNFRRYNVVRMSSEGQILPSNELYHAVNFQQNIYEVMGESLGDYIELSKEYIQIIREAIGYCKDFKAVLDGDKDFKDLRDRSDNAAKFSKIAASIKKSREMGMKREPHDAISQYWDLQYDLIEIQPGIRNKARAQYGYGYRHRDQGGFKLAVPPTEVERAYYEPPKTTRAFVRGTLIRKGLLESCEWSKVKIGTSDESLGYLNGNNVKLHEVVVEGLAKSADAIKYITNKKPRPVQS